MSDEKLALTPLRKAGFTLVELLAALAIGAIVIAGMSGVVGNGLQAYTVARETNDLTQQARFAMGRMVQMVRNSRLLLVPLADDPNTSPLEEHIRDSSTNTGVLAVTLPETADLNGDGIADADNDGDGLIDEDLPADANNDGKPGIRGIDDDGNGIFDPSLSPVGDDDESNDLAQSEDWINGIDDDGDGSIDEDPSADMNNDNCPGICGVNDNPSVNSVVDEGSIEDDDEDGSANEDWYDSVVYFLFNRELIERTPVPWDTSGDGSVTGLDYLEEPIASNVSRFRVERVFNNTARAQLVDITLELTSPVTGETVSLNTRVRVGGAL